MSRLLSNDPYRVLALLVTTIAIHLSSPAWATWATSSKWATCTNILNCRFPPSIADCELSGAFDETASPLPDDPKVTEAVNDLVPNHLARIYKFIQASYGDRFTLVTVGRDAIMFGYLMEALAAELHLPIKVVRLGCSTSTISSTDEQLLKLLDTYGIHADAVEMQPQVFFDAVANKPGGTQSRKLIKILGQRCKDSGMPDSRLADQLGFIGVASATDRSQPIPPKEYFKLARLDWEKIHTASPDTHRLEIDLSTKSGWPHSNVWYNLAELWNASYGSVTQNDLIAYGGQSAMASKMQLLATIELIHGTVRAHRAKLAEQIGCQLPIQAKNVESWPRMDWDPEQKVDVEKVEETVDDELLDHLSPDNLPALLEEWTDRCTVTAQLDDDMTAGERLRLTEFHKYCQHGMADRNFQPAPLVQAIFAERLAAIDRHKLLKRPIETWHRYLKLSSESGAEASKRSLEVLASTIEHHGADDSEKITAFAEGLSVETTIKLSDGLDNDTRLAFYRRIPQVFTLDRIFAIERSRGSDDELILTMMGQARAWRRFLELNEQISAQKLAQAFNVVAEDIKKLDLTGNRSHREEVATFMAGLRPRSVQIITPRLSEKSRRALYSQMPKEFTISLIYDIESKISSSDDQKTAMMLADHHGFTPENLAEYLAVTSKSPGFGMEIWRGYKFGEFTDKVWRELLTSLPQKERLALLDATPFESLPTEDSCRLVYDALRESDLDGVIGILQNRQTSEDQKFHKRFLTFAVKEMAKLERADANTMAARIKPLIDAYRKPVTLTRYRMRKEIKAQQKALQRGP